MSEKQNKFIPKKGSVMKLRVYGIYDIKAGYYKTPFMMHSDGEAIRGFSDLANDTGVDIGKHPEDYALFHLAEFDTVKGEYKNEIAPRNLINAINAVKVPIQQEVTQREIKVISEPE